MKTYDLGRPMQDGKELSDEAAIAVIDERQVLEFVVENDSIETTFKMLVNPALITAGMVQIYQAGVTEIALRGEHLSRLSEELEAATGAKVEIINGEDSDAGNVSRGEDVELRTIEILSESTLLTLQLQQQKAMLLAPAVESWNVPGTAKPDVGYLLRRTGVGPAALHALNDWFFPTTRVEEAETGTSPSPNTDSTSATLPPTPDAAPIQATS